MGQTLRDILWYPIGLAEVRTWSERILHWLHAPHRRRRLFVVSQIPLLILIGTAGYWMMFTIFQEWDDQGQAMMYLRLLLDGTPIYKIPYNYYGPFVYCFQWFLYGPCHLPLTHDVTRLEALACWLITVELLGLFLVRLGTNIILTVFTQAVLFSILGVLTNEPAHPQELAIVLITTLLIVSLFMTSPHRLLPPAVLGMLVGALLQTKINLGIFALAACGLSIAFTLSGGRLSSFLRIAGSALALPLPFALMSQRLDNPLIVRYAILSDLAIFALLITSFSYREMMDEGLPWSSLLICLAGCATTIIVVSLLSICYGTKLSDIVRATLIEPRRYFGIYGFAADLSGHAIYLSVLSCALALTAAMLKGRWRFLKHLMLLVKLLYGLGALYFSIWLYGYRALAFLPSLAWLVLIIPQAQKAVFQQRFPRMLLAWASVMESMWAYPVAGSQAYLSLILPITLSVICLNDGLEGMGEWIGAGWKVRGIKFALATAIFFLVGSPLYKLWNDVRHLYGAGVRTTLPGCTLFRMLRDQTNEYEYIVVNLKASTDTFLCSDGFNSLYFWTGEKLPSNIVMSHAIAPYTDQQQRELIDSLLRHPRSCVIIQAPASGSPPATYSRFYEYVNANFHFWFSTPTMTFMVRRDRQPPKMVYPDSYPK